MRSARDLTTTLVVAGAVGGLSGLATRSAHGPGLPVDDFGPAPSVERLETHRRASDGTDWAAALDRWSRACSTCVLQLSGRRYRLEGPVMLRRSVRVRGAAGGGDRLKTALVAAHDGPAVVIASPYAVLEDLQIQLGVATSTTVDQVGVDFRARGTVRNVRISGGRHGVRIVSSRITKVNANAWRLDRVNVSATSGAGILVDGPDSNAGLAVQVSVVDVCRLGSLFGGRCGAVVDSSFLGNTWLAHHISDTVDGVSGQKWPSFIVEGKSNRSVIIGGYDENGNTSPGYLGPVAFGLSGSQGWTGPGPRIYSDRAIGLEIQRLILHPGSDGLFLALDHPEFSRHFEFHNIGRSGIRGAYGPGSRYTAFTWRAGKPLAVPR